MLASSFTYGQGTTANMSLTIDESGGTIDYDVTSSTNQAEHALVFDYTGYTVEENSNWDLEADSPIDLEDWSYTVDVDDANKELTLTLISQNGTGSFGIGNTFRLKGIIIHVDDNPFRLKKDEVNSPKLKWSYINGTLFWQSETVIKDVIISNELGQVLIHQHPNSSNFKLSTSSLQRNVSWVIVAVVTDSGVVSKKLYL